MSNQDNQDYQWIIVHTRATDIVYFGPFKNYEELDKFFEDPKNRNIQCNVHLLISPSLDSKDYWYNPQDKLLEVADYLFDRKEEVK